MRHPYGHEFHPKPYTDSPDVDEPVVSRHQDHNVDARGQGDNRVTNHQVVAVKVGPPDNLVFRKERLSGCVLLG